MTIGAPLARIDGPLEVTGSARYAYEHWDAGRPLYGFIVGATIGRGHIAAMDIAHALQAPGVRLVMTDRDVPEQGTPDPEAVLPTMEARPCLSSTEIGHYGQPVALVVAETFEAARAAAGLVEVEYAPDPGRFDFASLEDRAYPPPRVLYWPPETRVGEFDEGFERAEVSVDVRYRTPYELSQPMEPQACLAVWDGDDLTVYTTAQVVVWARERIARTLRIDVERVHVIASYVGGGFGSKLCVHHETILAALAARRLGQPVKVAMTRRQMFHLLGTRATSSQRVRLRASKDGRLVAIGHDANMAVSPRREIADEFTARMSGGLYAAPGRLTRHFVTQLDIYEPEAVRAPGAAPGLLVLESAMDELAHALGIDPVELRVRNEPSVHPERGVPFSERRLVECIRAGAGRFRWERRPDRPASASSASGSSSAVPSPSRRGLGRLGRRRELEQCRPPRVRGDARTAASLGRTRAQVASKPEARSSTRPRTRTSRPTRSTATAHSSPRSGSTPIPARSGSDGCSACSRPAASSTPGPRGRSSSEA